MVNVPVDQRAFGAMLVTLADRIQELQTPAERRAAKLRAMLVARCMISRGMPVELGLFIATIECLTLSPSDVRVTAPIRLSPGLGRHWHLGAVDIGVYERLLRLVDSPDVQLDLVMQPNGPLDRWGAYPRRHTPLERFALGAITPMARMLILPEDRMPLNWSILRHLVNERMPMRVFEAARRIAETVSDLAMLELTVRRILHRRHRSSIRLGADWATPLSLRDAACDLVLRAIRRELSDRTIMARRAARASWIVRNFGADFEMAAENGDAAAGPAETSGGAESTFVERDAFGESLAKRPRLAWRVWPVPTGLQDPEIELPADQEYAQCTDGA